MRALVVLVIGVVAAACGERNPNACCNNAVECAEVGFDEVTPCLGVQVCIEGHCVDPTCTTSAECTDPGTPYCVGTTCVADCEGDTSCVGANLGTVCAPDGECVDCLTDEQCPETAPVCDEASNTCRECADDAECASGICLAIEGFCHPEADAVFVSSGGVDAGECTAATPCETVAYGLTKVTTIRRVLRLPGLNLTQVDGIVIDRDVYIDAAGTRLQRATAGPIIRFSDQAIVTIEGFRITSAKSGPAVEVTDGSRVVADHIVLEDAEASVDFNGLFRLVRSVAVESVFDCSMAGTLELFRNEFTRSPISTNRCGVTIAQNHLRGLGAGSHYTTTAPILIENNLVEVSASTSQIGFFEIASTLSGPEVPATIRFNTFINTEQTPSQFPLITCTNAAAHRFSSNTTIGHSPELFRQPTTCLVDHSLFDDAANLPPGEGNVGVAVADIFIDDATGNYRPAAGSPARGAGDPAQDPGEDIDGNPRPVPVGSPPDVGAFEVE
jgi:hypothetical protein